MSIQRDQDIVRSQTTTEAPSSLQNRYEYDVNQLVIYAGYAPMGRVSSSIEWTIFKYTYVNSQVTVKQTAFGAWDDRTLLIYS